MVSMVTGGSAFKMTNDRAQGAGRRALLKGGIGLGIGLCLAPAGSAQDNPASIRPKEGDLLVKVDIATMAHGLEGRSPMLDHEFMEFCASLPSHMKLRGRVKKYIFKRAVRDLLPQTIIERPKMGFGVPLDQWFRLDLREMAQDLLLSPRAVERGYFRREVVQRLLDEHIKGVRQWHYQLWNLLMLELWHRTFIDR